MSMVAPSGAAWSRGTVKVAQSRFATSSHGAQSSDETVEGGSFAAGGGSEGEGDVSAGAGLSEIESADSVVTPELPVHDATTIATTMGMAKRTGVDDVDRHMTANVLRAHGQGWSTHLRVNNGAGATARATASAALLARCTKSA